MTVTATSYTPLTYNGNGSTSVFNITFQFYEVAVIHIDSAGSETEWTENTHYTVTGGEGSTGSITVITTLPATGEQIRIERTTAKSQLEDFDLDNEVLENSLQDAVDRNAMVMQETSYEAEINLGSVESSKDAAAASAAAALSSENNAASSEANASTSEINAATSAASAAQSATNAQNSATASEASRQAAETLVNNAGAGDMLSTNNLSELTNIATARTNLGLGTLNLDYFANGNDGDNVWHTAGQDLKCQNKRAMVGFSTANGNTLAINYASDFEWLDIYGKHRNNINIERDWPGLQLKPTVPGGFGYIDFIKHDRPNQDFQFRLRNDVSSEQIVFEYFDANDVYSLIHSLTGDGNIWTKSYGWLHDRFEANLGELHIQDQKSSGSDGGTFTSGSWVTRNLNSITLNTISGASLSSNQITLPAGTYKIMGSAPAYVCAAHQAKIYNTSDASDVLLGTAEYSHTSSGHVTRSFVIGQFTLAATKTLELRHRCTSTKSSNGLGRAASIGTEIYSDVLIKKVD